MKKLINRIYYSLYDLIHLQGARDRYDFIAKDFTDLIASNLGWPPSNSGSPFAHYAIFEYKNPPGLWILKSSCTDIANQMLNRFCDDFCFSLPEDHTPEEFEEAVQYFTIRILDVFNFGYGKYAKILEIYKANLDDLMAQISSETLSRFNDTPQDEGDFSDDEHTTNITKTETKVDPSSVMGRINEIQNSFRNIEMEWLNEFRSLFLLKENIL